MRKIAALAAGLVLASCAPHPAETPRLPGGSDLYIFFESGLDRAPLTARIVPCAGADLCLDRDGDRVTLMRVAGGWRGRMDGAALALDDTGTGTWGETAASAVGVTWAVPPGA